MKKRTGEASREILIIIFMIMYVGVSLNKKKKPLYLFRPVMMKTRPAKNTGLSSEGILDFRLVGAERGPALLEPMSGNSAAKRLSGYQDGSEVHRWYTLSSELSF